MKGIPTIKLYGAEGCHKTNYYKLLLNDTKLPYQFLDVEQNKDHAEELRGLYENRKLNFPTKGEISFLHISKIISQVL